MDFISFIEEQAALKAQAGHTHTAANYFSAARTLQRFLHAHNMNGMELEEFSSKIALQLENYLLHTRGVCLNTSSFYVRQLRAVYNVAVRDGLCLDHRPFCSIYKRVAATRKRAANAEDLQALFCLDLTHKPQFAFARDLFYFSFLGRGIAFVDLAKLRMRQIEGNHLVYQRSKTGQLIIVEVPDAMRNIISRWHQKGSERIFPILPDNPRPCDYDTALRRYNRHLKALSALCDLDTSLTSYTARHSWASEAYRLGVPVSTISTCMGHTTETTTRIYLRSLSTHYIDQSAHAVLDVYAERLNTP